MPDVLPWDVAMNNRDRSDVGLWISYKRFDEALEQARADERERIIKLLEAQAFVTCTGEDNAFCLACGINLHDAIDIVKGETGWL